MVGLQKFKGQTNQVNFGELQTHIRNNVKYNATGRKGINETVHYPMSPEIVR